MTRRRREESSANRLTTHVHALALCRDFFFFEFIRVHARIHVVEFILTSKCCLQTKVYKTHNRPTVCHKNDLTYIKSHIYHFKDPPYSLS